MLVAEPQIVLERLRGLPGGEALLDAAAERDDVELVGGAVRDLLLGRAPRELDVVVGGAGPSFAGDAAVFAGELASRLNVLAGEDVTAVNAHERFITATVRWDGGQIDIAAARRERYPAPGALPEVEPASPAEDLLRRDFTVNAIAVTLGGERPGEASLHAAPDALEDLRAGRLRVLHDASFRDDPTRLLRMARYAARLGFAVEQRTATLAREAVAARALDTVSGARIGAELRLALGEPDAVGALAALDDLGLLTALHPRLRLDRDALERALALLPDDGRPDLLALACLTLPLALPADRRSRDLRSVDGGVSGHPKPEIVALLDRWDFPAGDRDRVAAAATAVPRLIEELPGAERPSALREAALGVPVEGVALGGALEGGASTGVVERVGGEFPVRHAARHWLTEIRHVRLRITGDDLIAAGIPEGPEIGRRLERVLKLRLDGELADGREAELQAALEPARA